jgi:ABC-type amino acid transport substrate-binding protein
MMRLFGWLLLLSWYTGVSAAQGDTLNRIRDSGAMRLGYIANAAPFSFEKAGAEPAGYSVELCRRVAAGIRDQLGLKQLRTTWVALTVQNRLAAVRDGKVDIECSTTTWTLSRQREVDFSLVVFVDGASMLTRADPQIATLADLKGRRIAVLSGTTTQVRLREALLKHKVEASVVPIKSRDEGVKMLARGDIDALASDRMVLIGIAAAAGNKNPFKVLNEDFSVEPYAFALPRGDADYRLAVNRVLAGLFRSGEIQAIYDQWLGPHGRPSLLVSATWSTRGAR